MQARAVLVLGAVLLPLPAVLPQGGYQEPQSVVAEIGGHRDEPDPPPVIAESYPAPPIVSSEEMRRRAIEAAEAMHAAFRERESREQRERETREAIARASCSGTCAWGAY